MNVNLMLLKVVADVVVVGGGVVVNVFVVALLNVTAHIIFRFSCCSSCC